MENWKGRKVGGWVGPPGALEPSLGELASVAEGQKHSVGLTLEWTRAHPPVCGRGKGRLPQTRPRQEGSADA